MKNTETTRHTIIVRPDTEMQKTKARKIAEELHLPCFDPASKDGDYILTVKQDYLSLQPSDKSCGEVYVDFLKGAFGFRRQRLQGQAQPLAKAVGFKPDSPTLIVDLTAGLGRDTFILASLGCKVIAVERNPVVFALLRDGLKRALASDETHHAASRISLINAEAADAHRQIKETPETVYLDPMYPHKKKSASVKKEMKLIRALVGDDPDSAMLFEAAKSQNPKRIAVKRPAGAPPLLPTPAPSTVIKTPKHRFDIYF